MEDTSLLLRPMYCLLCLVALFPEMESGKTNINIALMVPDKHSFFNRALVEPAIEEAIEHVQHKGLLPFHTLNVTYYNTECDAVRAPVDAFRFMNNGGHAFFGPVCDYSLAPVARYAPEWGLPVLSPGGMAEDFLDKTHQYKSLTRMGTGFDSMTRYILATMAHYRWPKMKLLYDPYAQSGISYRYCYLAGSAIIKHIENKRKDMKGHFTLISDDHLTYENILREDVGTRYSSEY